MTIKKYQSIIAAVLVGLAMPASAWKYKTTPSQMTGETTKMAMEKSVNSLTLPFPYAGKNHGHIIVRKQGESDSEVIVGVDKGQILCHHDDCQATVRYDEEPPTNLTMVPSADGSSDLVFFHNGNFATSKLREARRILIELTFFQAGTQVLEFKPKQPLKWKDPYATATPTQ